MLVVRVIFKAFALTGCKVDCWFTQGECPGLGASAPSGRGGQTCDSSDLHLSLSLFLSFLIFYRKS